MRHDVTLLKVQPPREWITTWIWWESVNRMPLQTLCSKIVSSSSSSRTNEFGWRRLQIGGRERILFRHHFPSVVGVDSLDRSDHAKPPVEIHHDVAGRLEAEPKQPRLRACRIELVHSFQNRVCEPHAFTEMRPATVCTLPCRRKSLELRDEPSTLSDSLQHCDPQASTIVFLSARDSRTRRMSSQMLGSPSVLTVTSWHPDPSIHFASERAACGSPPPLIVTVAGNVMPVLLSFAIGSRVECPLK